MFWTLLVTRIVCARSYETFHLIDTHCVRTYRVYSGGNESSAEHYITGFLPFWENYYSSAFYMIFPGEMSKDPW